MVGPEFSLVPFDIEDTAFRNLVSAVLSEEATIYIGQHPEIFSGLPYPKALEKSILIIGKLLNNVINHDPTQLVRNEKGLRRQIKEALKQRDTQFPEMLGAIREIQSGRPELLKDYGLESPLMENANREYAGRFGKTKFPFNEQLSQTVVNAREAMQVVSRPFVERMAARLFDDNPDPAAAEDQKKVFLEKISDPHQLARVVRGVAFSVLLRWYDKDRQAKMVDPLFVDYDSLLAFVDMLKNVPSIPQEGLEILAGEILRSLNVSEEDKPRFLPYVVAMMKQIITSGNNWLRSPSSALSPNNEEYWGKFFNFFELLPIAMPQPDIDFIFSASRLNKQDENTPHLWRNPVKLAGGIAVPATEDILAGLAMLEASGYTDENYLAQRMRQALRAIKELEGGKAYFLSEINRLEKLELMYAENMASAEPSKDMYERKSKAESRLRSLASARSAFTRTEGKQEFYSHILEFVKSAGKGLDSIDQQSFNYLYSMMVRELRGAADEADTRSYNIESRLKLDYSWDQLSSWVLKRPVSYGSVKKVEGWIEKAEEMLRTAETGIVPPIIQVYLGDIKRFVEEWKSIYPDDFYARRGEEQRNRLYKHRFKRTLGGEDFSSPKSIPFLLKWIKDDLTDRLKWYDQLRQWLINKDHADKSYKAVSEAEKDGISEANVKRLEKYFGSHTPKKLEVSTLPEEYADIDVLKKMPEATQGLRSLIMFYAENSKHMRSVPITLSNKAKFFEQLRGKGMTKNLKENEKASKFVQLVEDSFNNPLIPWNTAEGMSTRDFFNSLLERGRYVRAILGIEDDDRERKKWEKLLARANAEITSFEAVAKLKSLKKSVKMLEDNHAESLRQFIEEMRGLDLVIEEKPAETAE